MADFIVGLSTGAGIPTAADLANYAHAGAKFLRGGTTWSSIDGGLTGVLPTSGSDLTVLHNLDAYVQGCNARGIKVLLQVGGGSALGAMNSHSVAFSNIIIALANRYKAGSAFGFIESIEPGNETNGVGWDAQNCDVGDGGAGATVAGAAYANLMHLCYVGITAIGIGRPLLMLAGMGALINTNARGVSVADFTNAMYAATPSIKGNYDVWNTHRYTWPLSPSQAIAQQNMRGWLGATTGKPGVPLSGSQQIREANNDGTKPHAVTEFGIPVPNATGPMTPASWVSIMDDAINLYSAEPTSCYFSVFCDYDNAMADAGRLWGIWATNTTDGSHTEKATIFPEYQRLAALGTTNNVHMNKPSDWSNQDLGWSIPIQDIPNGKAGIDRVLKRILSTGSKLLICDFPWASFQPSNAGAATAGNNDTGSLAGNVFGSAKHDLLMDRCANFGIYVIAGCQYTPDWAKSTGTGNDKVPPDRDKVNYADYANFVWHVVDRYAKRTPGTLIAISVWNEPNTGGAQFWQDPDNHNGPYVVNYARMLTAAFKAVKTGVVKAAGGDRHLGAHPEVMVGNGGMAPASGNGNLGTSYGWVEWVNGLIANGATNSFDVFFVHPYMWQCDATETQYAWNPMNYIQPCYGALRTAGRTDVYAWATEIGGGTRPDNSGTDPTTFNCHVGGAAGGYTTGAPGGSFNTNSAAVNYTTAAERIAKDIAEWRSADFYDTTPAVNRQWSGPLCVWTLNDEAPDDVTWSGPNSSWQAHAGVFFNGGGDGTQGPAKPYATSWFSAFLNNGGPKGSIPDTTPPTTSIISVNGVTSGVPVVAGTVGIGIAAADDVGVVRVDVIIDGTIVGQAGAFGSAYLYPLDTTTLTNGVHQLRSKATDAAGNVSALSTVFKFNVQNSSPQVPNVTGVSPTSISTAGGVTISVAGTFLSGATLVEIGTAAGGWVPCTLVIPAFFPLDLAGGVNLGSGSSLDIVVPAHAAGSVHVRVTTPSGVSLLTNNDVVTFASSPPPPGAPTVTAVSPNSGGLAGGNHVTVTGTFPGTIGSVHFGGIASPSFTIIDATHLDVVVPGPEPAGVYDVTVTNGTGTSAVVPGDVYSFGDAPVVSLAGVHDGDTASGAAVSVLVETPAPFDATFVAQVLVDGVVSSIEATHTVALGVVVYQFFIDSTNYANGTHDIVGTVTNDDGLTGQSDAATVTFSNVVVIDTTPPTIAILTPPSGATVSGTTQPFSLRAVDDHDAVVPLVQLFITDGPTDPDDPTPVNTLIATGVPFLSNETFLALWDTTTVADGTYQLQASATDSHGNASPLSAPISVIVANDIIVPPPPPPPPAHQTPLDKRWPWRLYARDGTTLQRSTVINDFDSLDITLRFNDVGAFTLIVPTVAPAIPELIVNLGPEDTGPTAGILLFYKTTVVFSGKITEGHRTYDQGDSWEFVGEDDNALLRNAVTHPSPGQSAPDVDGHYSQSNDYYPPPISGQDVFAISQHARAFGVAEVILPIDPSSVGWAPGDAIDVLSSDSRFRASATIAEINTGTHAVTYVNPGGDVALTADSGTIVHPSGATAPSEDLLVHYINANVGPGAVAARRALGLLVAASQGRGTPQAGAQRFSTLLGDLQAIAAGSDPALGFRVTQVSGSNPLLAQVYVPVDRSFFVRFSTRLGNLTSFSYDIVAPTANVVYAGGAGNGIGRQFAELVDAASVGRWGRRETLTDHSDAGSATELLVDAVTDLIQLASPPSISLEPMDVDNARFVDDYFLGDTVTFVLPEGTTFSDVVVQVAIRLDSTGVLVKPAVGAGPRDAFAVFEETRRLADAVRTLQTTRES